MGNLAVSKDLEASMTKKEKLETAEETVWMWDRFPEYLDEIGRDSESDIAYIKHTMKRSMYHIFKMNQHYLLPHPGVFEVLGLDYMLDEVLKIWYLETAPSPGMQSNTPEKGAMQSKLITDV